MFYNFKSESPDFQDRGDQTLAVSDAIYKQPKPVLYYGPLHIGMCSLFRVGRQTSAFLPPVSLVVIDAE